RSAPPSEISESAASVLLALPDSLATSYVAAPKDKHESPGASAEDFARLGNLFDAERFATAPYRQRDGTYGRLFLIPREGSSGRTDVGLLAQLVSAVAQAIENTQLTDELVLKAAEHERFRISLDIHDTTV